MLQHKKTVEDYHKVSEKNTVADAVSDYQIVFADESGKTINKSFERIETSRRGKLLYNQIEHSLQAMGQSITVQEKRQILIDILKELC